MTQIEIVTIAACAMYPGFMQTCEARAKEVETNPDLTEEQKELLISKIPDPYTYCTKVALNMYRKASML